MMIKATEENIGNISYGAKVRLNKGFGTGTKYFVCYLSGPHCLIADSKRDCKDETGYIYGTYDIAAYEAAE